MRPGLRTVSAEDRAGSGFPGFHAQTEDPSLGRRHFIPGKLFGIVPGSCYGWPKNVLAWAGIDRAILDINAVARPDFAIVDGIVGMEGNGPNQGTPKASGVLILGSDPVAVDATCCRVMGLLPPEDQLPESGRDTSRPS